MWKELLIAAVGRFVIPEAYAWAPTLSVRMVRRAAARLPRMNDRMREQWEADLQEFPGPLSKIAFAAGLFVRWQRIVDALPAEKREVQANDLEVHLVENIVIDEALSALHTRSGFPPPVPFSGGWDSPLIAGPYGRSDSTMRRHAAFLTTITPAPLCLTEADAKQDGSS
jgi:hypothetical protein